MQPLCFILMPFGQKPDSTGQLIDFDAVYEQIIAPAVEAAGLTPLRADEEQAGGIIHKPMFERLVLCKFAIADLTTANANVFYELGVRHAVKPCTTILIYCKDSGRLPFDVAPLRAFPYALGANGQPCAAKADRKALTDQLSHAKIEAAKDSPLYQLLEDYPDIDHTKTDLFRERVQYSADIKQKLSKARMDGLDAIRAIERDIGDLQSVDAGPIIDLFLSYRAVKAWPDMIRLAKAMPAHLAETVLVQEQLAFALNRNGQSDEAEKILLDLIEHRGPSSETYGLLGRVYKDLWENSLNAVEAFAAKAYLKKSVEAYLKGFEADFRDAYPGVNAVTLMELSDPPDERRHALLPVVQYAVQRKMASQNPDYWDHATLLELAVLARDEVQAMDALGNCLLSVREVWEPETTLRNLRLIQAARIKSQSNEPWLDIIEEELQKKQRTL